MGRGWFRHQQPGIPPSAEQIEYDLPAWHPSQLAPSIHRRHRAARSPIYSSIARGLATAAKSNASRSEWKFGGWLEGIRSVWGTEFNSNTLSNVYALDCTIADYHEIILGAAHLNQVRFRNCTFVNILDDGFQTPRNMSRTEIGYCFYYNSAFGGHGVSGSDGGDDQTPGNWFMHHNIIDYRQERNTNWNAQPHPGFIYMQHSPDGNMPRKIYNNLMLFGPDLEEEQTLGVSHSPQRAGASGANNTLSGAANMRP